MSSHILIFVFSLFTLFVILSTLHYASHPRLDFRLLETKAISHLWLYYLALSLTWCLCSKRACWMNKHRPSTVEIDMLLLENSLHNNVSFHLLYSHMVLILAENISIRKKLNFVLFKGFSSLIVYVCVWGNKNWVLKM